MGATIDFVGGTRSAYFVHMTDKPHVVTVKHYRDRSEAETERGLLGGQYGYVFGSLNELAASQLPTLALLLLHRSMQPLERFTTRKKIERKVWRLMSTQAEKEAKQLLEDAKAAKQKEAVDKKQAAEAKKTEAADKKRIADEAKASKQKEAADKKAAAEKAKADKKAAADLKKADAAKSKQATELAKSRIGADETVTVLVPSNPKREGSEAHKRFALYQNGMTVKAFLDAGGTMADVTWDLGHRLISLTAPATS